ncbi:MAG: arsenosugar biosynthesis radical SAM protein ArsS [Proteobacteria bacterium]|nr:arsenosugar biosynthesis radical SAM protein ArsS [Pseudomonadota bacterium]
MVDVSRTVPSFEQKVQEPVNAVSVEILQINVGYRCNLQCRHCHVEAGPQRPEIMTGEVMEQCLKVFKNHPIPAIDITGGSPELHPRFRWFLQECVALNRRVLVRSNGTILLDKEHEGLFNFYADNHIEIVLSLPHVDPRITDRQRGGGVFARLIEVIRRLNTRGYGQDRSDLVLDLVHNPAGPYLPGSQASLELLYRETFREKYGVNFNHLFCITNMPIGRYLDYLLKTGNYAGYMKTLIKAFNPASLNGLMCKTTVSVGWDGMLYDCDFNQMLGLTIDHGAPHHISAFEMGQLAARQIIVGDHCYGCTAGSGSSCQGQTI